MKEPNIVSTFDDKAFEDEALASANLNEEAIKAEAIKEVIVKEDKPKFKKVEMPAVDSASVVKALQKDKNKEEEAISGIDLSVLKGDKRLPDENFDAYKARLIREKKIRKQYLAKGKQFWNSMFEGPYKRPKKKAKKESALA